MANTENTIVLTFELEKETKNTRRYQEVVPEDGFAHIGILYIQKAATSKLGNPDKLTITIEKS